MTQSQTEAQPAPRKAALIFIFITVMLDMLAIGMIVPVLPKLVEGFLDGDTARAARIFGLLGTLWALMQFIFMPVLGALSDRFGRRPVVLISNFGMGFHYLLVALAPSLFWVFVARIVSGVASASISTASAYVADIMPPEKRGAGFGMLGAAFGIGFIIGPGVGGLLGSVDPRLPMWVAAGLSLANAMYGLFVLPESLPIERRAPFRISRANPIGALRMLASKPGLLGLAFVQLLSNLAQVVLPSTTVLFTSHRFGWGHREVGFMLAGVGLCAMIVQAGLIGRIIRAYGERATLLAGLAFGTVAFLVFGLAPVGGIFLLGVPIMGMSGISSAAAQAMMTRYVSPSEQGRLQGSVSSVQGVAGMLGPMIFTLTFARFIEPVGSFYLPGAPFLLSSVMILAALIVAVRVTRRAPASAPSAMTG